MNVSVQMTEKRMKKIQKNRRKTGADYEKAAGFYLEQMGYEILQFNYRCRLGEIDLIAKDGAYYVFCEVKYRADERKGRLNQAVRQGLSARIRFAKANIIFNFAVCFRRPR